MRILILENENFLSESDDKPIIGKSYLLEDAVNGTSQQNKLFHALIAELYKWMLSINQFVYEVDNIPYDFSCPDWLTLKDIFKKRYGAGFESFVYIGMVWDEKYKSEVPSIMDAKTYMDIPEEIRNNYEYKKLIRGRLKSWAKYTKKQRINLLDITINLMKAVGVDSKKFFEILDGIEK